MSRHLHAVALNTSTAAADAVWSLACLVVAVQFAVMDASPIDS